MATQWYWRDRDTEDAHGPISFLDLVSLVRDHQLDEDDLVRPHYSRDWQTTDTVVGLYPMAQRIPTPRQPAPPTECAPSSPEEQVYLRTYRLDEVTRSNDSTRPAGEFSATDGSVMGMEDLEAMLAAVPNADDADTAAGGVGSVEPGEGWSGPAYTGGGSSAWDSVMQAAVDHVDSRADAHDALAVPKGWRGILFRIRRLVTHPEASRHLFRMAIVVACCVGFGYWAVEYSAYEMSRFPSRELMQQNLRFFPLVGTCEVTDYWALLGLTVILLGAVAYRGAMEVEQRWLEFD